MKNKCFLALTTLLCICTTNAANYGLWLNNSQNSDDTLSFANGQFAYNTDSQTITDSDGDCVRSLTNSQNTSNTHTLISRIHGENTNNDVVIIPNTSPQGCRKAVAIRNNSESVKLANAIAEAERIFSEEMTRMNIELPAPITARVQFGDASQFLENNELCIVETTYKDTTKTFNENYPYVGEHIYFTHCWYPLSLY